MNHFVAAHYRILLPPASFIVGLLIPLSRRRIRWAYIYGSMIWRGRKMLFVDVDDRLKNTVIRGYASTLQTLRGADHIYARYSEGGGIGVVRFDERGTAWCFGWEGEAADALRAAVALR